jgi:hypothetical protein
MGRQQISLVRFKWKTPAWRSPDKILAIWMYCAKGIPSFEFEIDPNIQIPESAQDHARHSANASRPNFIRITDPRIISSIGDKIASFNVGGAKGRGIIIGELDVPFESHEKRLLVMSTLQDWREWIAYNQGVKFQFKNL